MKPANKKRIALAALICLAPGGFVLGATLAANHYRKKRSRAASEAASSDG